MKKSIFTHKPRHPATKTLDEIERLHREAEREFRAGNRHRGELLTRQASERLENFKHRQEPGRRSIWTA